MAKTRKVQGKCSPLMSLSLAAASAASSMANRIKDLNT